MQEDLPCPPFSDGEIAFYKRFIREPALSRNAMLKSTVERWGFCERHAFGLLTVSASIPRSGLNTAATLYLHTSANAITVLDRHPLGRAGGLRLLRNPEQCPMCELGVNQDSRGLIHREWLALPNSLARLGSLLNATDEYWRPTACPDCGGSGAGVFCRRHFIERLPDDEASLDRAELTVQRSFLEACRRSLEQYLLTFDPDGIGAVTGEGIAALIAAAGWCSGWEKLLHVDGYTKSDV